MLSQALLSCAAKSAYTRGRTSSLLGARVKFCEVCGCGATTLHVSNCCSLPLCVQDHAEEPYWGLSVTRARVALTGISYRTVVHLSKRACIRNRQALLPQPPPKKDAYWDFSSAFISAFTARSSNTTATATSLKQSGAGLDSWETAWQSLRARVRGTQKKLCRTYEGTHPPHDSFVWVRNVVLGSGCRGETATRVMFGSSELAAATGFPNTRGQRHDLPLNRLTIS